jgi:purine-nucleoside phosphorylase
MPQTSIIGHAGLLIRGRIGQRTVLCLAGRIHAYEGYHMYQLTFTTRLMALLGVKIFMATNAAGGAIPGMWPGCIMMITDHLNLLRRSIGVGE